MTATKDILETIDRIIICQMWCAKYGTSECSANAECLSTVNKPYFKVKRAKNTWFAKWRRKHAIKRICKIFHHNCAECVYSCLCDGGTYFGVSCRLKYDDKNDKEETNELDKR